mgnify:CR=1 FL=1
MGERNSLRGVGTVTKERERQRNRELLGGKCVCVCWFLQKERQGERDERTESEEVAIRETVK